ncbi:MAG: zinc ABC transporter substrate-binding protein [Rhodobacteraceae bacterium]|nr:zinc ABC transporter substrate-binding protein [Paracoccaceae bacterium]TVR49947.1 MAG: manganese transporter [Paracoccaceae bacterium]
MSVNRLKISFMAAGAATLMTAPAIAEDAPLNVLATVGMIADVAQNVAGECATVSTLMGPGVDPHYYAATPADVDKIADAELILYVDRTLEERLADVLDNFRNRTPTVGLASATFDDAALLEDPDAPGEMDPHLWMDVDRWSRIAPVIAAAIAEQRPDCAEAMAANVEILSEQMGALHAWVGEAIATIPEGSRMLVTAHDAFYYFADAYGIEASEAIEGISTGSEASIGDIREVAEFVIENNVPAVFVETTINTRTIEALVEEVQSQGHDVVIGGALFSDAMGDDGTPEGTYIGMIRANTIIITEALGGSLPDLPEPLHDWAHAWDIPD